MKHFWHFGPIPTIIIKINESFSKLMSHLQTKLVAKFTEVKLKTVFKEEIR